MRKILYLILTAAVVLLPVIAEAQSGNMASSVIDKYSSYDIPALNEVALRMVNDGQCDSALVVYNLIFSNSEREKYSDKLRNAYNNAGYIYFYDYGNYERAYQYWLKALDITEKNNLPFRETTLLNIGNLHLMMQSPEKAYNLYREAFNAAYEARNYDVMLSALSNMAMMVIEERKAYPSALPECDTDVHVIPDSIAMKQYGLLLQDAMRFYLSGHGLEAIDKLHQAADNINTPLTPKRYYAHVLAACAAIYNQNDMPREALREYLAADSIAIAEGITDHRIDLNWHLYETYNTIGLTDSAQNRLLTMYSLRDSISGARLRNNVHEIEMSAEIGKMDEKLVEMEYRKARQLAVLKAVLIAATVIVMLLVWVCLIYRRERQKNRALYEKNLELMNITTPASKPQPAERPKMSDEVRETLVASIKKVLESKDTFNPDFSIDNIVSESGSNRSYVSQVINDTYGKSFSTLLSEIRIREACRLIAEFHDRYTIEAISAQVGYKSRSSFSKAFFKVTGMTPSEFMQSAKL